jgi:hypothetical protein
VCQLQVGLAGVQNDQPVTPAERPYTLFHRQVNQILVHDEPTSLVCTRVTKWKARTTLGWLKESMRVTSRSTGTVVSVLCSMTFTATSRPAHLRNNIMSNGQIVTFHVMLFQIPRQHADHSSCDTVFLLQRSMQSILACAARTTHQLLKATLATTPFHTKQ